MAERLLFQKDDPAPNQHHQDKLKFPADHVDKQREFYGQMISHSDLRY